MGDYRPMPEWLKKLAAETKGYEGHSYPYPYEKQGKLRPRESSGSGSPLDGTLVFRSLYHAVFWVPGFSYYANSMTGTTSYGMKMKLVRLAFLGEHSFIYSGQVQLEGYENNGESRPVTRELFLSLVDKCNALDADWPVAYERAAAEVLKQESAAVVKAEQEKLEVEARERLLKHGPALTEEVDMFLLHAWEMWLNDRSGRIDSIMLQGLQDAVNRVKGIDQRAELGALGLAHPEPGPDEPQPLDPRAEETSPS